MTINSKGYKIQQLTNNDIAHIFEENDQRKIVMSAQIRAIKN